MTDQAIAPPQHPSPAPFWGRSVRWRIVAGNVAILLLAVAAIGLTFWQLSRLLLAVETLETASNRVRIATDVRHASTGLLSDVSRLLPLQNSELFVAEVGDSLARLQASQAAMDALIEQTEDPQTLNALRSVNDRVQNIINVTGTMVRQAEGEQWPSVRVRVGVLSRDQQQIVNEVSSLVEQVRALEAEALARVAAARRAAIIYPTVVGLFALGLAALSITQITRSIAGPVERLTAVADRLATGAFDERVPVERQDEMGRLALAFNQMAERLESYYAVLEERVAERTRDLALAAEVGQRLSQVRALDALVQEAVERIRERFDLYYVQLYLTDESGQTLGLLAGTGEIGAELVERGHRLPVDFTSINGMAAREKEALVIPNTRESSLFRPNPLLPETRSEMAVPLLVGTDVIGVLDLQSRQAGGLSAEILPAFEVLAGQLAIAVGNARLFEEVNRARAELAKRRRESIQQGWEAFLNAIDREEVLSADYVRPLQSREETIFDQEQNRLTTSITFDNEPIGVIEVEGGPELAWTAEQIEVVNGVAQQVAQQVENLRLLAEAERYREKAEDAVRSLTREGWEEFRQRGEVEQLAYRYDGLRVQNARQPDEEPAMINRPLLIQGESIGELAVGESDNGEQAAVLVSAVADRLSAHIENLRLSRQTEEALATARQRSAELATLNRVVAEIGATLDLQESLQVVVSELVARTAGNQARVALLNETGTALTIVAEELDPAHDTGTALGLEIPVAGNILTQELLETRKPVLVADPQHDPRLAPMHELFRQQGIEMMILLPILAANEVIGTVGIDILEPDRSFTEEQERLAAAIILQTATAIQNARLFEQVQERVAETQTLYETSRAINISQSYQEILEVLHTYTFLGGAHHLSLNYFDRAWTETQRPEAVHVLARATDLPPQLLHSAYDFAAFPGVEPLRQHGVILVEDVANDTLIAEPLRRLLQAMQGASALLVPLVAGGQMLGFVLGVYRQPTAFPESDVNRVSALTGQAAVAIQGLRLLQDAQKRARHERILREVTASVRSVTDVELILKTAAREVGQALGRETFVYLDDGDNGSSAESSVPDTSLPETSTSLRGEESV